MASRRDADMVAMLNNAPSVAQFNSIISSQTGKLRKKRLPTLRITVNIKSNNEVNFKKILKKKGIRHQNRKKIEKLQNLNPNIRDCKDAEALTTSCNEDAPKYRYNVIEKLERQYGGGGTRNSDSEEETPDAKAGAKKKPRFANDYYDSGDSFLDDSELVINLMAKEKSKRIKTQHGGFFVNAGEIQASEEQPAEKQPGKQTKKRKREQSSDEWVPNEAQKAALREFADEFVQKKAAGDIQKNLIYFPHVMDPAFRKMDREIRKHEPPPSVPVDPRIRDPLLWRNKGYLREIKNILGIGEVRIKNSLKRVELHWRSDQARAAKTRARAEFEMLVEEALAEKEEQGEEAIKFSTKMKDCLVKVFATLATFVEKTNVYRDFMVQTGIPRKKVKDESRKPIWKQLSLRKKRKQTFEELCKLFPANTMTVEDLRKKLTNSKQRLQNSKQDSKIPVGDEKSAGKEKAPVAAPIPAKGTTSSTAGAKKKEKKDETKGKAGHTSLKIEVPKSNGLPPASMSRKNSEEGSSSAKSPVGQTKPGKGGNSTKRQWTEQEAKLLLEGLKTYGRAPTKVAQTIPGKTSTQVSKFITTKFHKWGIHFDSSGKWDASWDSSFFAGLKNYLNGLGYTNCTPTNTADTATGGSKAVSTPRKAEGKNEKPFEIMRSFKTPPEEQKKVKPNSAAEKKEQPAASSKSNKKELLIDQLPSSSMIDHDQKKQRTQSKNNNMLPQKSNKFESPPIFSKADFEVRSGVSSPVKKLAPPVEML